MKISVVMSVYNGGSYLSEAIDSVLCQTFGNFEFIIVNNGSTDRTEEILQKYAAKDDRIRVITNRRTLTYVEGRAIGIRRVITEWFALMDADDICEPDRFEKQINLIRKADGLLGAVGTWARYINSNGEDLGVMRMEPTTRAKYIKMYENNEAIVLNDPSAIIRREAYELVGGYRKECVPAADLDLWYRISEIKNEILIIPEYLMKYRIHADGNSVAKTMFQRKKTHFINYNMRRRRNGLREVSWKEYDLAIWSSLLYRIPRLRKDYSMTWYKRSANYYGSRNYCLFIYYLIMSFLVNPIFVLKRLYYQKSGW